MTVSGLLTNREAEAIALEVYGPPVDPAARFLNILAVCLVTETKEHSVPKAIVARILEEAARLATTEEAQP